MKNKKFYISGILATIFLSGTLSFYASSSPDGLEKVADKIGFIENAKDHNNSDGVLADYGVKGIENPRLSVGIAGVIGVAITGGVAYLLFLGLAKRKRLEK